MTPSDLFRTPVDSKSRPVATRASSTLTSRALKVCGLELSALCALASIVAEMSQYSADTNAMRSRSRSTMMRVATDCTRPADSFGMTFFHSTGDTS